MKKRKDCKGYYDKIEYFFGLVQKNVDEKPYLLLFLHGICFLLGYACSAFIWEDNTIYRIILCIIGFFWGISLLLGLIYMILAIFKSRKKRKKLFALAFGTVSLLLFLGGKLFIIFWAIDEFYYFTEWIPIILLELLSCGWCVYLIKRIRKALRGEEVELTNVPFWLIVISVGSCAPAASRSGRRNMGKWLPRNLLYYLAYLGTLLNLFLIKYNLDLLMYCKITLFGRKKQ